MIFGGAGMTEINPIRFFLALIILLSFIISLILGCPYIDGCSQKTVKSNVEKLECKR